MVALFPGSTHLTNACSTDSHNNVFQIEHHFPNLLWVHSVAIVICGKKRRKRRGERKGDEEEGERKGDEEEGGRRSNPEPNALT